MYIVFEVLKGEHALQLLVSESSAILCVGVCVVAQSRGMALRIVAHDLSRRSCLGQHSIAWSTYKLPTDCSGTVQQVKFMRRRDEERVIVTSGVNRTRRDYCYKTTTMICVETL